MTRRRKLAPPPGSAWRLFHVVYLEPTRADRLLREIGARRLRGDLPFAVRHHLELADLLQRQPTEKKSVKKAIVLARDLWMGMDFALCRRAGKKLRPGRDLDDVLSEVANGWDVGEYSAATARDMYSKLADRAIDEYVAGGVPEAEALKEFRQRVNTSRKLLLQHHGPWIKRPRKST